MRVGRRAIGAHCHGVGTVVLFCRIMDELPQFPFYGGGVAGGECVVGDVACNYTAGGYDAAVAYGDAGA